jgi:hypothetical protein
MIGIMTNLYLLYFCYDKSSIILNGGIIFIKYFIYFLCVAKETIIVTFDYAYLSMNENSRLHIMIFHPIPIAFSYLFLKSKHHIFHH